MPEPPAIALVLGAAVLPDGTASRALTRRARHAATLFRKGEVSAVVASGGVVKHPPAEAELIREICLAEGVPKNLITCERESHNTLENLRNSREYLPSGAPVTIVTDRFHAPRVRLVARRLGVSAKVSCPPLERAPKGRVLRAWLREIPALIYYLVRRV